MKGCLGSDGWGRWWWWPRGGPDASGIMTSGRLLAAGCPLTCLAKTHQVGWACDFFGWVLTYLGHVHHPVEDHLGGSLKEEEEGGW